MIDKKTREYRAKQMDLIKHDDTYSTSIKFIGGKDGQTKYFNISREEFNIIRELLTEGVRI